MFIRKVVSEGPMIGVLVRTMTINSWNGDKGSSSRNILVAVLEDCTE